MVAQDVLVAQASKVPYPAQEPRTRGGCLLSGDCVSAVVLIFEKFVGAYSSKSASWYVLGAYTRRCFFRRTKNALTTTTARSKDGARVDTRADIEDGPPRLLPDCPDILMQLGIGEGIVAKPYAQLASTTRLKGLKHQTRPN